MSKKDDGGLAFPYEERNGDGEPIADHYGMSLRDYFAAKAMQGYLACPGLSVTEEELADASYGVADAMLRERIK